MADSHEFDAAVQPDRPGKTRTWWHPLLARLLDCTLGPAYSVREEVLVGKLPLRVDILLVRRKSEQLTAASGRDLDVLLPLLRRYITSRPATRLPRNGSSQMTTDNWQTTTVN
jgi:hypothetical protein